MNSKLLHAVIVKVIGYRQYGNPFFSQRFTLFGRSGTPNGTLGGFAMMHAQGFFSEAGADIFGVAHDLAYLMHDLGL